MNNNYMEQEILQLEKRIADLTEWKNSRISERFVYPLDNLSTKILHKNQIRFTGNKITNVVGVTLTDLITVGFGLKIDGRNKAVIALMPLKGFSANVSDVITASSGDHNLKETDRMYLTTTNTLPSPLLDTNLYYPVEITSNTFKFSLTQGGSAIDITDVGTGSHYYAKIQ